MTLAAILLTALALSVLYCVVPDAVNTEALRRGFSGGFRRGVMVELGSVVGDIFWATLALAGLAVLIGQGQVRLALGLFGAALLLLLAVDALIDAKRGLDLDDEGHHSKGDFVTGALISLGNPLTIVFWISLGGMVIETLAVEGDDSIPYLVFFGGFMIGVMAWTFVFPLLVERGRRYLNARLFRAINVACALFMIYLAAELIRETVA